MLRVKWTRTEEDSKAVCEALNEFNNQGLPEVHRDRGRWDYHPAEPTLKRQAKAREALKKLTKGMTRTVEADGTEVYE